MQKENAIVFDHQIGKGKSDPAKGRAKSPTSIKNLLRVGERRVQ